MQSPDLIFAIILTTAIILALFAGVFVLFYFNNKNKQLFSQKQKNTEIQFMHELVKSKMEIKNETLKSVSAELHDNIGQMLTLLKLQTGSLNAGNLNERKKDILTNLDDTIREVKQLQTNLNAGLENSSAIWENLLNQIARVKKIQNLELITFFDFDFIKTFDSNKQLLLVRIIQEFLNNSLKYARCSQIHLNATTGDTKVLNITLSDNGCGFNFKNIKPGEGLRSIKNRAQLLNAELDIKSEPGLGTQLILNCRP
jgi:two-component system NarL family sensor kinase